MYLITYAKCSSTPLSYSRNQLQSICDYVNIDIVDQTKPGFTSRFEVDWFLRPFDLISIRFLLIFYWFSKKDRYFIDAALIKYWSSRCNIDKISIFFKNQYYLNLNQWIITDYPVAYLNNQWSTTKKESLSIYLKYLHVNFNLLISYSLNLCIKTRLVRSST